MMQTAVSLCLRKPTLRRLKHPSSPIILVSSLPPNLPEFRLLLWSNLLASTSPRQATPPRPSVSCLLRLMPTNPPAPSASSSSPMIQPLRLAIPLKLVRLVPSRNKEGRAKRGSGKPTGRRERLAKIAPNLALRRLSRTSNPNPYHRRRSLRPLLCNPRVPARTGCHQTLR